MQTLIIGDVWIGVLLICIQMQIIQLINVYLLVQQIQTIMLIIMCAYIIVQILCILLIQIQDLVFLDVQTLQRLILVMEIQQLADVFSIVL